MVVRFSKARRVFGKGDECEGVVVGCCWLRKSIRSFGVFEYDFWVDVHALFIVGVDTQIP